MALLASGCTLALDWTVNPRPPVDAVASDRAAQDVPSSEPVLRDDVVLADASAEGPADVPPADDRPLDDGAPDGPVDLGPEDLGPVEDVAQCSASARCPVGRVCCGGTCQECCGDLDCRTGNRRRCCGGVCQECCTAATCSGTGQMCCRGACARTCG